MGFFPYDCVKCGGAYERCGAKCDPADTKSGCGGEGGQFCYEDTVVCIVDKLWVRNISDSQLKTYQYIFDKIKNCPITCTYTGHGSVIIHTFNEANNPYTISVYEYGSMDEDNNVLSGRFWCASCYSW